MYLVPWLVKMLVDLKQYHCFTLKLPNKKLSCLIWIYTVCLLVLEFLVWSTCIFDEHCVVFLWVLYYRSYFERGILVVFLGYYRWYFEYYRWYIDRWYSMILTALLEFPQCLISVWLTGNQWKSHVLIFSFRNSGNTMREAKREVWTPPSILLNQKIQWAFNPHYHYVH